MFQLCSKYLFFILLRKIFIYVFLFTANNFNILKSAKKSVKKLAGEARERIQQSITTQLDVNTYYIFLKCLIRDMIHVDAL